MTRIGWIVLILALCAKTATAQTDPNGPAKPLGQEVPSPPAAVAANTDLDLTLPSATQPNATLPNATFVEPAATVEAGPADPALPEVLPLPVGEDQTAQVAALRAAFEALRQREAAHAALRQPAAEQTLAELQQVEAAIAANAAALEIETWKAQNLPIFAQSFAAGPRVLPEGIPPGTEPDLALAVIAAQTTLYAQPDPTAQNTLRTVETRVAALRVAELGAFTLVWSSQDGFAFVLSQYRQVY